VIRPGGSSGRNPRPKNHEITGVGEYEPNVEVVEEASRERFLELLYEAVRT